MMPLTAFSNRRKNLIAGSLCGYGMTAFCLFLILVITWSGHAPTLPDIAHGLTYAHNEHGNITYFSGFQATSCWLLFWTSMPIAFAGMGLAPKKNVKVLKGRLSVSMRFDQDDPHGMLKTGSITGVLAAFAIVFGLGPPLVRWLNSIGFVAGF